MSDFVIGWPQVWRNGSIYTTLSTSPTDEWVNTSGGGLRTFWYDGSAQSSVACAVDGGSTQVVDLVCWAGLNNCIKGFGDTVRTQARGTNTAWSGFENKTSAFLDIDDLHGVDFNLYCHDLRASGFADSYRYFAFYLYGTSGTHTCRLEKLYPCQAFDFDREPDVTSSFELDYRPGAYRPALIGRLSFSGIADAKVGEFYEDIYQYKDVIPVFLYDSADVFGINKAAFVWIKSCQRQMVYRDNNRLTITFEECL